MIEYDFGIPKNLDSDEVTSLLDRLFIERGLAVTLRSTLKSYPDSVHWHLKKPSSPGTLEVTWWPSKQRLWAKVSLGRDAPWIAEAIAELERCLASKS